MVPAFGELNQRDRKSSLGKRLSNQRPARSNVDEDVHAIVPRVGNISSRKFDSNQSIVDSKNDLFAGQSLSCWPTMNKSYPTCKKNPVVPPHAMTTGDLYVETEAKKKGRASEHGP